MNTQLALLLGGIIPAILFASLTVLTKVAAKHDIGLGLYVSVVGLSVLCTGLVLLPFFPDKNVTTAKLLLSGGIGIAWAIGMSLVTIVLLQSNVPVSKVTLLHGFAPLITVGLAFYFLGEFKHVHIPSLLAGGVLIVLGGALVARA